MGPVVKMHHTPVGLDCELSPGFHALARELLGLRCVTAIPLRGQPSVAPLRKHRQGHVHSHVAPHCTGQTGEGQDMDAAAEAVLDAMASGGASDAVPCTAVEVVGHEAGRLGLPPAVHGHLPSRASIPMESRGLLHRAAVWMAACGDSAPCLVPGRGWEGLEATQKGGAPTPHRHQPEAPLLHPGQCGCALERRKRLFFQRTIRGQRYED